MLNTNLYSRDKTSTLIVDHTVVITFGKKTNLLSFIASLKCKFHWYILQFSCKNACLKACLNPFNFFNQVNTIVQCKMEGEEFGTIKRSASTVQSIPCGVLIQFVTVDLLA